MATKIKKALDNLDPLSEDDRINEAAIRIIARYGAIQWKIGDELRQLVDDAHYGDVAVAKFGAALNEGGVSYGRQMLDAMLAVSRAFPRKSQRIASLGWQHHRVVGQRPDRFDWIQEAADEGWSSSQLESQIKMADEHEEGEQQPGFRFWF